MINCVKYLKQKFQPQQSNILRVFILHAEMIKSFVYYFNNDIKGNSNFRSVRNYNDHGIEYICKLLIEQIILFSNDNSFSLENYVMIYYNIEQFEQNVSKKHLESRFSINKTIIEKFSECKDIFYQKLIASLKGEVEESFANFFSDNFKKKNTLNKEPSYFKHMILTFKVFLEE